MSATYPSSKTYQLLNIIDNLSDEQIEELLRHAAEMLQCKRKHKRIEYRSDVSYASEAKCAQGVIKNISAGGMYLEPRGGIEVGQPIRLTFKHPRSKKNIKIQGVIVREDNNGIGVQFSRSLEDL